MIVGINGYIGSGKDTVAQIMQYLDCKYQYKLDYDFEKFVAFGASDWKVKKFAGKLKQIASILTNIPVEKFEDQEFKKTLLGPEWSAYVVSWKHGDEGPGTMSFGTEEEAVDYMQDTFEDGYDPSMVEFRQLTVREFLQKLGTEAVRDGIHYNAWVNALFADYTPLKIQKANGPISYYEEGTEYPDWIISDCRFVNEAKAIKDRGGIIIRVNRGETTSKHPSEISLDHFDFDYIINNNGTIDELVQKVHIMCEKFNFYGTKAGVQ